MLKVELLNPNQPDPTLDDFKVKIYGEDELTTQARKAVERWSTVSGIFEKLAFICLGIGFIWTIAILVYCTF